MMTCINKETCVVAGTVSYTTRFIFRNNRKISNQSLNEYRQNKTNHVYIHRDPIYNVVNTICKYSAMEQYQGTPKTDTQLIIIGKMTITNAGIFAEHVEWWNAKPSTYQTWLNFKTHFTDNQIAYEREQLTQTNVSLGYINQQANVI